MLVRILDKNLIRTDTGLMLDRKPVGVAMLDVVFSKQEMSDAFQTIQFAWQYLFRQSDKKELLNHSRWDLVIRTELRKPKKIKIGGDTYYDYGKASVVRAYEDNMHAPECASALDAMHNVFDWKYGKLRFTSKSRLVGQAIAKHVGSEKFMYVQSKTKNVKRNWGHVFYDGLIKGGLRLTDCSERYAMKHPGSIYRFGDARLNDETEFSPTFTRHLYKRKGLIVNSLPGKIDVSSKEFLKPYGDKQWDDLVGRSHPLNGFSSIKEAFPPHNWVGKPFRGASGAKISFGKDYNMLTWPLRLLCMSKLHRTQYGLYEACWAHKLELPDHPSIAVDFNISALVNGSKLRFLYPLMRTDWWDRYWDRGTINVSTGSGIVLSVRVV